MSAHDLDSSDLAVYHLNVLDAVSVSIIPPDLMSGLRISCVRVRACVCFVCVVCACVFVSCVCLVCVCGVC